MPLLPSLRNGDIVLTEEMTTNPITGGMKGHKPENYSLIPWKPGMDATARVYQKGSEKYSRFNWARGYDWSLSMSSLLRHVTSFVSGEDIDPDDGEPHLAHAVFHCLTLMYFMEHHKNLDDRHYPGHRDLKDGHASSPPPREIRPGDVLTFTDNLRPWNGSKVVNIGYGKFPITVERNAEFGVDSAAFSYYYILTVNGVPYAHN